MAQHGHIFRKGCSWFLRFREDSIVDGKLIRKQKCIKLAEYGDRYRSAGDLDDIVAEKMSGVREARKCPESSDLFVNYVESVWLPFVQRTKKPSTYAAYKDYFDRYIRPYAESLELRDFGVAIVSRLLERATETHELNTDTVGKIRSIIGTVFTYAMGKGHYPGKSKADNPASGALIPESATEPEGTVAATREEVTAILRALNGQPLARAAVAIMAFTGTRPGEAIGLKWEEWDRAQQHIAIRRAVWRRIVGTTKTEQSERFVAVTEELRMVLLDLWRAQASPIAGYILAGPKNGRPVILKNLLHRVIRPILREHSIPWHGWYSLRRFHGTVVRSQSGSSDTAAKALGNSRDIADRHYIKPVEVLPDVRKAVNAGFSGLVQ